MMEMKGGMGKSAYGNAVHSITGNGEARCLVNPPLLTSPIWGTAIPADLVPPMGPTQGVFVLGLSPDLGVPLCCLLCRSLGIPETEIMKATWGFGSGNVHVLHFTKSPNPPSMPWSRTRVRARVSEPPSPSRVELS